MAAPDTLNCQRVFKKTSPNNKLTLYLCSRDLLVENGVIDRLYGVLCVDPESLESKKVFGQVTLTFRYGREDEEVMGLKFCNEAVMSLAQLYPPLSAPGRMESNTPLQEALLQRLGCRAHAFSLELTPAAPPSVQLVPAKEYRGAPIGTSYDVRAYVADDADSKLEKRTSVRMGIRVVQGGGGPRPGVPASTASRDSRPFGPGTSPRRPPVVPEEPSESEAPLVPAPPVPRAVVDKPFLLSDGRVALEASLDRPSYSHGEPVRVSVLVDNSSHKSVRRIKVFVVQHVDVCMFSNGKFKNVVAATSSRDECPVGPGGTLDASYVLRPARGSTKNWIALEDSYSKNGASLASTVVCGSNAPEDRNVFAIYVSYYVKVKLSLSAMGGELSLKLPFVLAHSCREDELVADAPLLDAERDSEIVVDAEAPREAALSPSPRRLPASRPQDDMNLIADYDSDAA